MDRYKDIENAITEIARSIYSSVKGDVPTLFDRKRWLGEVMEWAMKEERFKVQMLRFVDLFPSLNKDELLVRMLKEYFGGDVTPLAMKWGIKGIADKGLVPKIAAKIIRPNLESMASQFVAGRDTDDLKGLIRKQRKEGLAFTIDLLGEVVLSDNEAAAYQRRYIDLLEILNEEVLAWDQNDILDADSHGRIPHLSISMKISSTYSQLDPINWDVSIEKVKEGLRPIFKKAAELDASITIDMEHYYLKEITIAVFKSMVEEFSDYHHAGIALQCYLRDSRRDIEELIKWTKKIKTPINVRLVKGAYWDYEITANRQKGWPIPVLLSKDDTDRTYEDLTRMLLENREYIRPEFATHNIRSISNAIAVADALELSRNDYEIQMLFGMAEPVRTALKEMGLRVRVYNPAGELLPGIAYLVRRLLENTSNESFLRKSFVEGKTFEELIRPPEITGAEPEKAGRTDEFRNEPLTDFSRAENRETMTRALEHTKEKLGGEYPIYIGAEEFNRDRQIISINPANPEEIIGKVSSASSDDAEIAIGEGIRASKEWRKMSAENRAAYLFKAAEELRKERFDLAALEVYETGKTWKEADADIAEAIDFMEYYGREMIRLGQTGRLGDYPGEYNEYLYEPRGVGAVISPWNFPIAIPAGMIAAGIVTGNAVIFKPSGLSPVSGYRLFDAFRRSGLPSGVLQFLPGPGDETGEYLVAHPEIEFISFTGSKEVGQRIIKLAGEVRPGQRNIKKVIAEMGGKNAIIIDETADLDEAVKGVIESSLGFQGQKCSACSRVIISSTLYERFCIRLRDAMDSVKIGPPDDPANTMGPVIDKTAYEKIDRYIEYGRANEKTLFLKDIKQTGYFKGPVIFTDVDRSSRIAREEIFGPVITIMKTDSIDESIVIANSTEYALTAGFYSRSPENINRIKSELDAGNIYINRGITGALVGRQPFGGHGMSGVGSKAGGPDYLLQFMHPKSISENTMRKGFAPEEGR